MGGRQSVGTSFCNTLQQRPKSGLEHMADEFRITKDLATISATATELAAVNQFITEEITSQDFLDQYDDMLLDIVDTYRGLQGILQPILALHARPVFNQQFGTTVDWYSDHYQPALSQPRINAEFTFQKYLQFRKRRETKTNYPLLKSAFARLHDFIDKWIDNDIWLALTIDACLKTLNRVLVDLAETQKKDSELAFIQLTSLCAGLVPYLAVIEKALENIEGTGRCPAAAGTPLTLSQSH